MYFAVVICLLTVNDFEFITFLLTLFCLVLLGGISLYLYLKYRNLGKKYEVTKTELGTLEKYKPILVEYLEMNEKFDFYSKITSSLKTPLALILTSIESLIFKENQTIKMRKKMYLLINNNASRLMRMLDQLMDIRLVSEKKMQIDYAHQDLILLIREILEGFKKNIKTKKIRFKLHLSHHVVKLPLDAPKIEIILVNLLNHSLKSIHKQGEITVSLNIHQTVDQMDVIAGYYEIIVKDNGIGFSNDELQPFLSSGYNNKTLIDAQNQSSEFNLFQLQSLVELMNGKVNVYSVFNHGTEVVVSLPILVPNAISTFKSDIEKTAVVTVADKSPSLLILVENEDFRRIILQKFKRDFTIYFTDNEAVAINITLKYQINLIIVDDAIVQMNSYDFIKKIKSEDNTCMIPLILLSYNNSVNYRISAYQSGVIDYILKPLNIDILKLKIENVLTSFQPNQILSHHSKDASFPPSKSESTADLKFMDKVKHIAIENLDNVDFDVASFANELDMSRGHFYRKLITLTNQTPVNFIKNFRLQKAADLLLTTHLNITEIAVKTGFRSLSYFTKCFTAHFNSSPVNYQKTNKSGEIA